MPVLVYLVWFVNLEQKVRDHLNRIVEKLSCDKYL